MLDSIPQVTRYMSAREALFVLTICDKRLRRTQHFGPLLPFRHGIKAVDQADTFATMSVMGLCNHIDPGIGARARSILDGYVRRQPGGRLRAVG